MDAAMPITSPGRSNRHGSIHLQKKQYLTKGCLSGISRWS